MSRGTVLDFLRLLAGPGQPSGRTNHRLLSGLHPRPIRAQDWLVFVDSRVGFDKKAAFVFLRERERETKSYFNGLNVPFLF